MANTRFNNDECRTKKLLEESTGPGRYMLNTPGWGQTPTYFNDPHIRMQQWGGNLRQIQQGHPIDIDSDLMNLTRPLTKDCTYSKFPFMGVIKSSEPKDVPNDNNAFTEESRVTHPAFTYRTKSNAYWSPMILNPQENVCMNFQNNLNTRIFMKDNYIPK